MRRIQRLEPSLTLGAVPSRFGTAFRVYTPGARAVELLIESGPRAGTSIPMTERGDGSFGTTVSGVKAGHRYRYRVGGRGPLPDPASRFQPSGVHGPSEVVDPRAFEWTYRDWRGASLETLIVYELHVGTFTPEGTFASAMAKLPHLRRLGVTAIELMPVHEFPGDRGWGYDPAALFAPARCYGTPDDLRRLVDAAHREGIAVLLDVVYNHLGPDGAYVAIFDPHFQSKRPTPWGRALNLDGKGSDGVRAFLIENALHWLIEYRLDGLRVDATHAMKDRGEPTFLSELSARVDAAISDREVVLIAEDDRNLARIVRPVGEGGFGLDAQWSFDFHRQIHRIATGERAGWYRDFKPSLRDLATLLENGWLYSGQPSHALGGRRRGSSAAALAPAQHVCFLQTHDEVGNRPHGERLNTLVPLPAYRAASALLLFACHTPLLFMGQEWAASTPFEFFCDHTPQLGARIAEARRKMFAAWPGLRSAAARAKLSDPQALETFVASRLAWDETTLEPHASALRFYQALISLRRTEPALRAIDGAEFSAQVVGRGALVLIRCAPSVAPVVLVVNLGGAMRVDLAKAKLPQVKRWDAILTSEDPAFAPDARPMRVARRSVAPSVTFRRAGAWVARG